MRILIISQYFWPENFRINELARELAARGNQVTVLTGVPNYPGGNVYQTYRSDPSAYYQFNGVEIIRVPLISRGQSPSRLLLNYLSFAVSASVLGVWKLRGRVFDRILINQPSPATVGLPGVILRAMKSAPTLFWVQDLWPDTLTALGVVRSRAALYFVERYIRWVYSHTDHLLAQSQSMLPRLREQASADMPLSYLPNWAEIQQHALKPQSAELAIPSNVFKIFFLGNLGQAQDFPAVLDAATYLRKRDDIHWYLVGDGRQSEWIRDELQARDLTSRVHLLGVFPPEEMPRFHHEASVLLVSLKRDPLFTMTVPSKVQSYLAAGVPIVGMLDGEGARIIREANAGLTCPAGDSRGLANAIVKLADMTPRARAAFGAAGRDYSHREFEFSILMDRVEMLLRTVKLRQLSLFTKRRRKTAMPLSDASTDHTLADPTHSAPPKQPTDSLIDS